MPKKIILQDPFLSEYVYDCISKASPDRKKRLTAAHLRKIKTPKAVKRFAIKSSMDEKFEMLARLGYYYTLTIGKDGIRHKDLKDAVNDFKNDNNVSALNNLMKGESFATNNRQTMFLLNMMSNLCHSDSYLLNRDFHKLGNVILGWKDVTSPTVENINEVRESIFILVKLCLNICLGNKYLKEQTQMGDIDFNILMYLQQFRNNYVLIDTIKKKFGLLYRKTIITAAIKRLEQKAYAERPAIGEPCRLQITSLGESEIFDWLNKRISETLNY